ncbi:MAG TPA: GGDEF domain-containing protein [Vicinamibacterales bacterium]|nr:GGDEF domain-containing protein [Vicinamibacterales bacterium]
MNPELLLWRWSTTAQTASALMIAIFFLVLARSVRRAEMQTWVNAWLANLLAMVVTSVLWVAQPTSEFAWVPIRFGYFFFKTMFVTLLALGAWRFVRPRLGSHEDYRLVGAIAAYALVASFTLKPIDLIGVSQSAIMGLLLGVSAILLVVQRVPRSGWLAAGFAIRAILGLVEAAAYLSHYAQFTWIPASRVGIFLAAHSSLDVGAEWVIALGCVLILYRTIQTDLTKANMDLLSAKETLQDLVDHDALTGLSNRRALPAVLRSIYDTGGTLIFFDLNDFKEINDSLGHQVGDECLKAFAAALQGSFRPSDHVFRFAGDEFVVIAPSAQAAQVTERLDKVRERLKAERVRGHQIGFSAGSSYLAPHGDAEAAMKAADEAMYVDKAAKPGGRRRAG